MEKNNPYQTPVTTINPPVRTVKSRFVRPGRGAGWIAGAFGLYAKHWFVWSVIVILFMLISIVMLLIPFVGGVISSILSPVFMAGFVLGAQAIDEGEDLTVGHLFAGFSQNTGTLMGLGAIYFAGIIAIFVSAVFFSGSEILWTISSGSPGATQDMGLHDVKTFGLAIVIFTGLVIPLRMAMWFAPALVVLESCGVFKAMKLSLIGCLKNILPLLVYFIVAMVIMVAGLIPFGLGLLIVMPVLLISVYTGYKDIYST